MGLFVRCYSYGVAWGCYIHRQEDMYRYVKTNLYKELDWEYFWIFMALKFDYFLPLLSWILGKLGAYPESTQFTLWHVLTLCLLDLYHDITLSNKDMTRRTRVILLYYLFL